MRTVWRVLAILAAALVVVGALVAFRQTEFTSTLLASPDRTRLEVGRDHDGRRPDAFFDRAEKGGLFPGDAGRHAMERAPDPRGVVEVIKNLIVIGVIVALVAGILPFARRILSRRPATKQTV